MTTAERIFIDVAGPSEGGELGTPPVLVEHDHDCQQCGNVHDIEACPNCGADVFHGFGLGIGPGFGEYKVCEAGCGWFCKRMFADDEE